ncbi:MAG: 30S ribosomal protein S8 [Bacteroidetes bacterium]|jgi:small subunit ribosomal protein S8|nr:30S ribosomal protein S8 [Bacteroidota bacterium]MBR3090399.1 30S ribosomal protein S8 [Bacteroidota bacterium]
MPVTDQIADYLTRIRNAGSAKHKTVLIPSSKLKVAITEILKDQGYITDFELIKDNIQDQIKIYLRYFGGAPAIREIKRISKPGRRVYVSADNLPRIKNGLGTAIISTSQGVMSEKQAKKFNIGGEFICSLW